MFSGKKEISLKKSKFDKKINKRCRLIACFIIYSNLVTANLLSIWTIQTPFILFYFILVSVIHNKSVVVTILSF